MNKDNGTPHLTRGQPCLDCKATHPPQAFEWSYYFKDGSCLVGQVKGHLDRDSRTLLNPTQMTAIYLDGDGQTVLGSWQDRDFACFEVVNGTEI